MNSQDIRVQKTKKAIQDALFSLLNEKPINKITIKELADTANVNRKTFYAHYNSIDGIVNEIEDELIVNLREFLQQCMIDEYGMTPYLFILFIDKLYSSNTAFFENMVSVRNYHFIAEKIKKIDPVTRKVILMKTVGSAGLNTTIDIDRITEIHGDLVDYMDDGIE